MDLKNIFDSIIPENIKDVQLVQDAMDIFIRIIEENSQIAIDIKNIYDNRYDNNDSVIVQDSKKILREAMLNTYMTSLYNVLKQAQRDSTLKTKLDNSNFKYMPLAQEAAQLINDEYFITNKNFKERIGTEAALNYAHNLGKFLESNEITSGIKLTEVQPMHFEVEGSLVRELYESFVKELAHPIGFTYNYFQTTSKTMQDNYGLDIIYDITNLKLQSLDGLYHIFLQEHQTTSGVINQSVIDSFLLINNPLTGEKFNIDEIYEQVTVFYEKEIINFIDTSLENDQVRNKIQITFSDGSVLTRIANPVQVSYVNSSNIEIYDYSAIWTLFADYSSDYNFLTTDTFSIQTISVDNMLTPTV